MDATLSLRLRGEPLTANAESLAVAKGAKRSFVERVEEETLGAKTRRAARATVGGESEG